MAFKHNSTVADGEIPWGRVNKSQLPRQAYANMGEANNKSTWSFPHHWVKGGGNLSDSGVFTTGEMFLHRGGLNAAWAAAQGARSGQEASPAIKAHLNQHRERLGLTESAKPDEDRQIIAEGHQPFGAKMSVDRQAGLVRNVPILGRESPSRKREYTAAALSESATMFEGIPFYGDRGSHEEFGKYPSPFDLIGCAESAHYEPAEGKLRADIRPVKQMAEWFFGIAEDMPHAVGCSPVMAGVRTFQDDKEVIVRIAEVHRLDLVSKPGTVSGLHESARNKNTNTEDEGMEWDKLTVEQLRANRSDLVALVESAALEGAKDEGSLKQLAEQVKTLQDEKAELAKKVDDFETAQVLAAKAAKADALIAESELPKEAITEHFISMVRTAPDEEGMKALIADRKLICEQRKPQSSERTPTHKAGENEKPLSLQDDDGLVSAVKAH